MLRAKVSSLVLTFLIQISTAAAQPQPKPQPQPQPQPQLQPQPTGDDGGDEGPQDEKEPDKGEGEDEGKGDDGGQGDQSGEDPGAAKPQPEPQLAPGTYTKANWPTELTRRPITLAKGMLEIGPSLTIDLSKNMVGKPITIKPDISYGITDKLSVGLTNASLCLTGKDNGCADVFNSLGLDATFAFMSGNTSIGVHGGLDFPSFDPAMVALRVGVLGKLMFGRLAVVFDPSIRFGFTNRDKGNKEILTIPIQVQVQATPNLAAFLDTGLAGPFDGFGDGYSIPLGVGALFAISNKIDVGLRFAFPNLGGKNGGADFRTIAVFGNFRI